MTCRLLAPLAATACLLALAGCDTVRAARDDLARLTSPPPKPPSAPARRPPVRTAAVAVPVTVTEPAAPELPMAPTVPMPAPVLAGYSESELRNLFGLASAEESRPPGKQLRYREGKCTLDVQLYPDLETRQYGTVGYKVRSDDDTDEARRACLVWLQSRLPAGR